VLLLLLLLYGRIRPPNPLGPSPPYVVLDLYLTSYHKLQTLPDVEPQGI
jgi:hypothetical protein